MLLVPRQLLRAGMTGDVPYYGGRFTPAQAYAASHPASAGHRSPVAAQRAAADPSPLPEAGSPAPATDRPDARAALRHLRDSGVLTAEEYADLLTRTDP